MRRLFCTMLFLVVGLSLEAAHTKARLLLGAKTVKPGDTVLAGVQLKMDPEWHTYWKNSGGSGMPTTVDWELPAGVTAGVLQWPVPEKLPEAELTTYIYKNEAVLLSPLTIAKDAKPGELRIKAKVSWLECAVQCVPGDAEIEATFAVAAETTPSEQLTLLEEAKQKLPQKAATVLNARGIWDGPPREKLRPLIIEWRTENPEAKQDFYPESSDQFEVQPETVRVGSDPGQVRLLKRVKAVSGDWPTRIPGVLIEESSGARKGYEIDLPITSAGTPVASGGTASQPPLWQMLLYAFLGGLILNFMPCVLPVIALKILGFVGQASQNPARVRALGLVYGLGVVVSFLALAGLVLAVKAAGHSAGWGMQFGNPQFLVALTVLMTLVALNLFGLFEITPGGKVMDTAGHLAAKHGPAGAFFNGVLATILATPCTAPFLGAALGFAFTQSAGYVLLIFIVVALGLAAPYVVLSWHPAWLRFVPKPGRWMERFKIALGFPMLATAVWLFSLLPIHYGTRSWWLAIFLVLVACAAWVYGEFYQRATSRRSLGMAVALLLLLGYVYVVEGQLQWRSPAQDTGAASVPKDEGGIPWEKWSPAAVTQAREEGHPVLVDFTADWCLTCQANKKFALEVTDVRAKLKEINAVALLGDYTRLPADITAELNRYGRAGVPLVLVYPKNQAEPAIVLPEALTPRIVINALEKAAK